LAKMNKAVSAISWLLFHFLDFAVKFFVESNRTQKTLDREIKELSIEL